MNWEHFDFNGQHFRLREEAGEWPLQLRKIGPSGISWSSLSQWRTRAAAIEAAKFFVPARLTCHAPS